jgi:hypothetical protein
MWRTGMEGELLCSAIGLCAGKKRIFPDAVTEGSL